METIKTISINNNITAKVIYSAWIDNGSINADGHTISTDTAKFYETVKVTLTVNGKDFSGEPRKLRADNKFDEPLLAKGAVAMVGTQPVGQDTYDKIITLIAAAKNETMTEELIIAERNTSKMTAAAESNLAETIKADARHDAKTKAIYKKMDATENR